MSNKNLEEIERQIELKLRVILANLVSQNLTLEEALQEIILLFRSFLLKTISSLKEVPHAA